jgi:hypothetical protein
MVKKQPLKTQSVLLSRDKFTKKQAEAWIKKHDYKTTFYGKKMETTDNYYRFRQAAPKNFKKGKYVTKEISDGVLLVLGNLV